MKGGQKMAVKPLTERIGEEILASVPSIDPVLFQILTLHAVESSGLWAESQKLTDVLLGAMKQVAANKTPIFFLPWHQIRFLIDSVEKTALHEKAFGV
jgi:hypothetical protein